MTTEKRTPSPYTPSILVVDDDTEIRVSFRRTLEEVGYFVSVAANGREAWKLVVDRFFDLLILDLSMPEEDGIELIRSIVTELPQIKIIAVSGFLEGTLLRIAKNLGAISTLHKPVAENLLLSAVCEVLAKQR